MNALERQVLVFSFYRDAELRGARLLLNLHAHLRDPDSQVKLTRHLADETRHAWLWTRRIAQMGKAPVLVSDGYQRRLGARIGVPRDPLELLALTIIAETRALERYRTHAALPDLDPVTADVLEAVTGDETWHLSWVEQKMNEIAARRGDLVRAQRTLERYRAIERDVYASLTTDEAELIGGFGRVAN